jgi:hypothetical protein
MFLHPHITEHTPDEHRAMHDKDGVDSNPSIAGPLGLIVQFPTLLRSSRRWFLLKLVTREAAKEDRDLGKQVVLTSIEDSQHCMMESMGNAQAQS